MGKQNNNNDQDNFSQFPKGIEGPRGDKESAFQSRKFFEEQRNFKGNLPEDIIDSQKTENQQNIMENNPNIPPMDIDEIESQSGELGQSIEETEAFDLVDLPPGIILETELEEEAAGTRSITEGDNTRLVENAISRAQTISISNVRTSSQRGSTNTFLRTWDALTFVININASQDMVNSGRKFNANYQIIDFDTNTVVKSVWTRNIGFNWGTSFWISRGNNWGPAQSNYTTAAKWGLGNGLYIYRASIEVIGTSAFSFSKEHVFRVR